MPRRAQLRRLPVVLAPFEGEAFAGYVARLAYRLGAPTGELLAATGVVDRFPGGRLPLGYGLALDPSVRDAFAYATRLAPGRVDAMQLAAYEGIAVELAGLELRAGAEIRRWLAGQWAFFAGSQFCPGCLAEDGGWRLAWRLPWSFVCLRHRLLLQAACPSCGGRVGGVRPDRRMAPAFLAEVPDPRRCSCPDPGSLVRRGPTVRVCGASLTAAPQVEVEAESAVLLAQSELAQVLASGVEVVGSRVVPAQAYLAELRSVCALLLYAGERDDLGEVPAGAVDAFERWRAGREAHDQERAAVVGDRRQGARTRCYWPVPRESALMAAIVAAAMRVLADERPRVLRERLEPLAARARARHPRYWHRLAVEFRFSPRLADAWAAIRAAVSTPGRAAAIRSGRFGFHSGHVPPLFWRTLYERRFAELLPGTGELAGRRFCSIALVRLAHGCSWKEAALALGLSQTRGQTLAAALQARMTRAATAERFWQRLEAVAERLDAASERIDYGARRRELARLAALPPARWQLICANAGVRPGRVGGRNVFAAAWVWAELTGGDAASSPAARAGMSMDSYRRFLRRDFPTLESVLRTYCGQLVFHSDLWGSESWLAAAEADEAG